MTTAPRGTDLSDLALLADPVRRALYLHVASQPENVGREEAAAAVGISRSLAAFHLDKLVDAGLLVAGYRRLSRRTGPGAGRPAKVYRRSEREVRVNVPPRDYELAARVLARAQEQRGGREVDRAAYEVGRRLGEDARPRARRGRAAGSAALRRFLAAHGFQPFHEPDGTLRLGNCPFHALAAEHPEVVCGMNLSLLRGVLDGIGAAGVRPVPERRPGTCCVAFTAAPSGRRARYPDKQARPGSSF